MSAIHDRTNGLTWKTAPKSASLQMIHTLRNCPTIHLAKRISHSPAKYKIVPSVINLEARLQELWKICGHPFVTYLGRPTCFTILPVCGIPTRLVPINNSCDARGTFARRCDKNVTSVKITMGEGDWVIRKCPKQRMHFDQLACFVQSRSPQKPVMESRDAKEGA